MAVTTVVKQVMPVTNCLVGRDTMAAGSLTVALPQITEESLVFVCGNSAGVTGALRAVITAGTGFVVTSLVGAGDAGLVGWCVMIPSAD